MTAVGPSRLVLINSGKFDYGEVDLGAPLHLVGPNNVGKTTLIATLQFLYIDGQRHMHFSRPMPETRRYYFPGRDSYVLFECLTPRGIMVVGAQGLGPLKNYEFRRFTYRGGYSREDFIDSEGRVRDSEEISRELSLRDCADLSPSELRSALTGIGGSEPDLGLVPVGSGGDYGRFRSIFRNLLRLSHLSQRELKEFLIEVNRSDLRRVEIDLAGDFTTTYRQVRRQVTQLNNQRAVAGQARRALELAGQRAPIRRELPTLRLALVGALERRLEETEAGAREAETARDRLLAERKAHQENRERLQSRASEIERSCGRLEQRLADLRSREEELADYMPDLEAGRLREAEQRLSELTSRLREASREDPEQVEARIRRGESELSSMRRRLANLERAVGSRLRGCRGFDGNALRLLNPDLPFLPEGGDGVRVVDRSGLESMLAGVADRIFGDVYSDGTVEVALEGLTPPPLGDLEDATDLRTAISGLEGSLDRDREVLESVRERVELERGRDRLREDLDAMRARRHAWERLEEDRAGAAEWESDLAGLEERRRSVSEQMQQLERELAGVREGLREREQRLEELKSESGELLEIWAGLPSLPEKWGAGEEVEASGGVRELHAAFRSRLGEERELSGRITDILTDVELTTYELYRASDEEETLERLREDVEALEDKEKAVRELWKSLASDLGQAFKGLMDGLETLRGKVTELNRLLAGVSVSNLERLSLRATEQRHLTDRMRQIMEADRMPLFSDREAVDRSIEELGELLQRTGRIELGDLFGIGFHVRTADGGERTYPRLEAIESNGTTITIKVLVNLMLLQGLLVKEGVRVPFYLDEASSLDRENLCGVVQTAWKMGFPAVLASPSATDVVDSVYFMRDDDGRVSMDPETSRMRLHRHGRERPPPPDDG
ncbi:hypothetical protein GF319_15935 [Candidatus Bathyarchaeota archaeon]|nr:hypothetical protein [Candidatus Bathyarchaeota archaeon]